MSDLPVRYNEVRQKSIHNAFQRREGIYDQFFYWRIRSLEVDLHHGKIFKPPLDRDWYVYHSLLDDATTVNTFSDFLDLCAGVHRAIPEHEVITLFVDIKQSFNTSPTAGHSAERFDQLLQAKLGPHLFTPAQLLASAPGAESLQAAIADKGWPTLESLRGKFIVTITGSAEQVGDYATTRNEAHRRLAFIGAAVKRVTDIDDADPSMVFFNMDAKNGHLASHVSDRGFVARTYYVDDPTKWDEAVLRRCHHLATDMVNAAVDPWASTTGSNGAPFTRFDGGEPEPEPGDVGALWATSGDQWDTRDSFFFHYRTCPAGELENRYDLYVSGANSHVEDWTKGGIQARVDLRLGSPYFGVFRTGEKHGLRVQYRPARDGPTTAIERLIGPEGAHDRDTLVFMRLSVSRDGHRARAWGSVTAEAGSWVEVGAWHFDEPLVYQGLAVSGHDNDGGAKFLFGPIGDHTRYPFDRHKLIGDRDDAVDRGWVDWTGQRRWRVSGFDGPG